MTLTSVRSRMLYFALPGVTCSSPVRVKSDGIRVGRRNAAAATIMRIIRIEHVPGIESESQNVG